METKNAELELSLIKKMMEDSRRLNIDNGIHYIFWGMLVTFALLLNYSMLLLKVSGNYIGLAWFILMIAGAAADGFIGRKQSKSSRVTTFTTRIMGSLWFASGIAMFIYGFLGTVTKAYSPVFICPVISTSLGISYFTSGAIQQIKWLQNISYGWWAGAAFMFVFPSIHTLLVFAVMMICFQVIPGFILNKRSKQDLISQNYEL